MLVFTHIKHRERCPITNNQLPLIWIIGEFQPIDCEIAISTHDILNRQLYQNFIEGIRILRGRWSGLLFRGPWGGAQIKFKGRIWIRNVFVLFFLLFRWFIGFVWVFILWFRRSFGASWAFNILRPFFTNRSIFSRHFKARKFHGILDLLSCTHKSI